MDFSGPHHHHHHHRRDDEDDVPPPPRRYTGDDPSGYYPPPAYGGEETYGRPRPPAYGGDETYGRPPPPAYGGYPRPPAYDGGVHHVSHETSGGYSRPPAYEGEVHHVSHETYGGYSRPPAYEGEVHHVSHETYGGGGGEPAPRKPTVRVFCKANEGYSLTVRDGKVCLADTDPNDESQHWIKDMKYSTRVKDEEGYPAFSLVNKATGEALKHSLGQSHPVRLMPYNPDYLDESVLWTESRDVGEQFRCIRMVNNIYLNFDAFHGDKDHGGVHDGTILVLWEWCKGDNQRWKIVPW